MVQQKIKTRLSNQSLTERIQNLQLERENFVGAINRVRWKRFDERDEIFRLEKGETFPSDEWDIPKSDQFNLVRENARYSWAAELWNTIKRGDTSNLNRENEKLSPFNPSLECMPSCHQDFFHISTEYFTITEDNYLKVEDESGSLFVKCKLPSDNETISEIQDSECIRIDVSEIPEITLFYNFEETSYSSPDIAQVETELRKSNQVALSVAVASGSFEVAQVEISRSSYDEFINLFNELDLYYTEVLTTDDISIFLVSHSERGQDRIQSYINSDKYTVDDYIELLGYPLEVSYFVDGQQERFTSELYDRYPSEEFLVYLALDDEIESEELCKYLYCPYRSPPSEKQARYAIQLGRQVEQSVREQCRIHDSLDASDVLSSFTNITPSEHYKPLFMSKVWPIKPEESTVNNNL